MKILEGSCLCGKVKIQVPDEFEHMGNCHCSQCRKFTGADYSSVGGISSAKVRFITGETEITRYQKSEETELAFCSHCGSSLYSRKLTSGKHNIRLGILDSVPSHQPSFHIFVGSKAPWYEITDDFAQFEKRPTD